MGDDNEVKVNVKLKTPGNEQLLEATLGENGYGFPPRISGYEVVGRVKGELARLFDLNHHPEVEGYYALPDPKNIAWSEMSEGFWEHLIARIKEDHGRLIWINTWFPKPTLQVHVYEEEGTGRRLYIPEWRRDSRFALTIRSRAVRMRVTNTKAEIKARKRLDEILSGRQCRELLVTGGFVEVGKSGVHYLIRGNRPTIAYRSMSAIGRLKELHFLAALCYHPLGYYADTFTGCLPPSDEMLAIVKMIRADEHHFWRVANQHELEDTRSGI